MSKNENAILREELEQASEILAQIAEGGLLPAVVVSVGKTRATVMIDGQGARSISRPKNVALTVGLAVNVHPQTFGFVSVAEVNSSPLGATLGDVSEILEDGTIIVSVGGNNIAMHSLAKVEVGDRVYVDRTHSLAIGKVNSVDTHAIVASGTGVSWDDIGGNAVAKEALIEAIEQPLKSAELMAFYGATPVSGILLLGPPGCGKTMLGKAAATALGAIDGFFYVKGPEILSPYVGESEAKIRRLFSNARNYFKKTGQKAVIFIDECDAILGNRGARHNQMEKTIVPMFLSEMDGFDVKGAIVILATNRPHDLDPAVVRDGRFDRKISVLRPNIEEGEDILSRYLVKVPTLEAREELTTVTVHTLYNSTFAYQGQVRRTSEYVSGAMIAGVCAKAKDIAMKRDLSNETRSGVTQEDFNGAIELTLSEMGNATLEHV